MQAFVFRLNADYGKLSRTYNDYRYNKDIKINNIRDTAINTVLMHLPKTTSLRLKA